MSDFITKFKNFLTGGVEDYEEENFEDETNLYTDEYGTAIDDGEFISEGPIMSDKWNFESSSNVYETISEPVTTTSAQAVTTPVYQQPSATVVMLSPYDIRTSQIVCDHIRQGHIVICNLTASSNNQRVVDYISGGVYAFDGRIEPTAVKTTFVCTPKNVNLYVEDNASENGSKVSAL